MALPFRAARSLIDVIDTLLPPLASSTSGGALLPRAEAKGQAAGNLGCAKSIGGWLRGRSISSDKRTNPHRINALGLVVARLSSRFTTPTALRCKGKAFEKRFRRRRAYGGNPMRRSSSFQRGSECRLSNGGCALIWVAGLLPSSTKRKSTLKASSLSPSAV